MHPSLAHNATSSCFEFPGFAVNSVFNGSYHTDVVLEQIVPYPLDCPNCTQLAKPHSKVTRKFLDVPSGRGPTKMTVTFARGMCTNEKCHIKTFKCNDQGQFGIRITSRLKQYIEDSCFKKNFTKLSKECGVSEGLVRKIANDLCDYLDKNFYFEASKFISIDGVNLNSGKDAKIKKVNSDRLRTRIRANRTIISDSLTGKVIEVLPDEKGDTISNSLLDLPWGKRIECVVIDMSANFYYQVREALGENVKIIVDRWHVIKNLNESMDAYRKGLKDQKFKALLRKFRIALTIKEELLQKKNPKIYQELVDLKNHNQKLEEVYSKHQEFLRIYDAKTRIRALQRYEAWKSSMSYLQYETFVDFINTVERWKDPIFSYWYRGSMVQKLDKDKEYKIKSKPAYSDKHDFLSENLAISRHWKGLTNGRAERMNQTIRNINRSGGSYSFKMLRAKALFSFFDVPMEFGICSECRKILKQNRKSRIFGEHNRKRILKNLKFPDKDVMLLPPSVCENCAGTSEYVESKSSAITRPYDNQVEDWLNFAGLRHVWSPEAPRLRDDPKHMEGVQSRINAGLQKSNYDWKTNDAFN